MSNKTKRDSPLVTSVLALQEHLSEIERVGARINAADLTSDIDLEFIQKLLNRFAESGQGISEEVGNLSRRLQEAQVRAEDIARGVSRQAEVFKVRRDEHNEKLEQFRILGERVGEINGAISQFRRPPGQALTDENRIAMAANVPGLEEQLAKLIGELEDLRDSARNSHMKTLEKNAGSLTQSLKAVQVKLHELLR